MNRYFSLIDKSNPLTYDEELDLVAQLPDPKARDKLILGYLRLVLTIAKKYAKYGDMEDLIGYGIAGLIDAVDRHCPTRKTRIYALAQYTIRNSIQKGVRESVRLIRVPKAHYALRAKITKIKQNRAALGMPSPSEEEFSKLLGCTLKMYRAVIDLWRDIYSLDCEHPEMDGSFHDLIPGGEEPWAAIEKDDLRESFSRAWADLTPLERKILQEFYFDGKSDLEIGATLKLRKETIGRRRKRYLNRLNERMAG